MVQNISQNSSDTASLVMVGVPAPATLERLGAAEQSGAAVLFEPQAEEARAVKQTFADPERLTVVPVAVADHSGTRDLRVFNFPGLASTRAPLPALFDLFPGLEIRSQSSVDVIGVADALDQMTNLPGPLHLYLNTPGSETVILDRISQDPVFDRVEILHLRCSEQSAFEEGRDRITLEQMIRDAGFALVDKDGSDPDWPELTFRADPVLRDLIQETEALRTQLSTIKATHTEAIKTAQSNADQDQARQNALQAANAALRGQLSTAEAALAETRNGLKEAEALRSEIARLGQTHADAMTAAKASHESALSEANARTQDAIAKNQSMQTTNVDLRNRAKKAEELLLQARQDLSQTVAARDGLEQAKQDSETRMAELAQTLEDRELALTEAEAETSKARDIAKTAGEDTVAARNQNQALENTIEDLRKELAQSNAARDKIDEATRLAQSRNAELTTRLQAQDTELQTLRAQVKSAQDAAKDADALRRQISAQKEAIENGQNRFGALEKDTRIAQARNARISQELDTAKKSLRALRTEAEQSANRAARAERIVNEQKELIGQKEKLLRDAEQASQAALADVKNEAEGLKASHDAIAQKLLDQEAATKTAIQDCQSATDRAEDSELAADILKQQLAELTKSLASANKSLKKKSAVQTKVKALRAQIAEIETERDEADQKANVARNDLAVALRMQTVAQSDLQELRHRFETVAKERDTLQTLLQKLTPRLQQAAQQLQLLSVDPGENGSE